MSSAFTHKTRPINVRVELLPDPHNASCNDLFLSSPNYSRLFFLGVADGVVAPPERMSPCLDLESPLSVINQLYCAVAVLQSSPCNEGAQVPVKVRFA